MRLHHSLQQILAPAYPCPEFSGSCAREMHWNPSVGHVPRGFAGATGGTDEVELVLVVAEPGEPDPARDNFEGDHLDLVYRDTMKSLEVGRDQFHRNVQFILNRCWPSLSFAEQMRKVWFTESVLCSAQQSAGPVSPSASNACGRRYLLAQLAYFPQALVVALGTKAKNRLERVGVQNFYSAFAVGRPGCNHRGARPSWEGIAVELARRRTQRHA